jgi:FAD/FMN-containing dehydrogenase
VDALAEVARAIGQERVQPAARAQQSYGLSTIAIKRQIAGAVQVGGTGHVQQVVRIAARHKVPLYPISRGHNWGYGAANPVVDGSIVVDLSGMDNVLDFDPELGTVTVEPGVTQAQLFEYLQDRGSSYMVPTHGGGPDCSVLANALERGYGLTPDVDHFHAATRIRAVLPSGELYEPALTASGGAEVDGLFKWGLGPYLDGMFTQGHLGIVTEMTVALVPKPEEVAAFLFWIAEDELLEEAVDGVRTVLQRYPGLVHSINLMNRQRTLSMVGPYPKDRVPPGGVMSEELVADLTRHHGLPVWSGVGGLFGTRAVVRAARRDLSRIMSRFSRRVAFVNRRTHGRLGLLRRWLPLRIGVLDTVVDKIGELLDVLEGRPSRVAMTMVYWRSGQPPRTDRDLDPAADGRGLLWYAPLVPMRPEAVRRFVQVVGTICPPFGVEPLITLTAMSPRCFDSTIPILFDPKDADETRRAYDCRARLVEVGMENGFIPYRIAVDQMSALIDGSAVCWRLVDRIKRSIDPDDIIAPGRYTIIR